MQLVESSCGRGGPHIYEFGRKVSEVNASAVATPGRERMTDAQKKPRSKGEPKAGANELGMYSVKMRLPTPHGGNIEEVRTQHCGRQLRCSWCLLNEVGRLKKKPTPGVTWAPFGDVVVGCGWSWLVVVPTTPFRVYTAAGAAGW